MLVHNILISLSILGILDAFYILYSNKPNKHLPCPGENNCNLVINSQWNKFLGVKNEIWGIIYYLIIILLVSLNFILILQLITLAGLFYSLYLTYLQFFKIKQYCLFCLGSATINLILFLITILLL